MSFDFRPPVRASHDANTVADVWRRVDRTDPDGCWPWTGAKNSKGYGQMRLRGRMIAAHRVVYEAATGTAAGPLFVLHSCDNPECCNPAHLFLGTAADNNRDCRAKGRNAAGSRHPAAKLNETVVREIRAALALGEQGLTLARKYGVTPATISLIRRGRIWRNA